MCLVTASVELIQNSKNKLLKKTSSTLSTLYQLLDINRGEEKVKKKLGTFLRRLLRRGRRNQTLQTLYI